MNQNENFIKQLYKGHDLFIILKVYLDLQQIFNCRVCYRTNDSIETNVALTE